MKKIVLLLGCLTCLIITRAQVKKTAAKTSATILKTTTDSFSYALGYNMANFYKQQGVQQFNTAILSKAINDVFKGSGKSILSEEQMNAVISNQMRKLQQQKPKSSEEIANRKAGEAFLAENKNKPGITTTASGLQYQILKEGTGPKPSATDNVRCHYHGTLINGTVFDSSVDRKEPAVFQVNGVIAGWVEALQLMPTGSKWRLYIPADLAYGSQQAGPSIAPGSTLIFDVELLEIIK